MRRVKSAALALAACAAIGTGCGGDEAGSGADKRPVDFDSLVSCLKDAGLETSLEDADLLAANAGVGGVQVNFERNELNIAVERSPADAENTLTGYRAFIQHTGEGQLRRVGTAVIAYNKTPSPEEAQPVDACLAKS